MYDPLADPGGSKSRGLGGLGEGTAVREDLWLPYKPSQKSMSPLRSLNGLLKNPFGPAGLVAAAWSAETGRAWMITWAMQAPVHKRKKRSFLAQWAHTVVVALHNF